MSIQPLLEEVEEICPGTHLEKNGITLTIVMLQDTPPQIQEPLILDFKLMGPL